MIIGTAGHIDHGKTALIKALTGIDGDRLKEEKARGITIDLGFAYYRANEGPVLGFVDVPGHERFVHTMLAGASGIDTALLTVAADDSVKPQTLEHLAILNLLGVSNGVVAITKSDLVTPGRIADVARDIKAATKGTALTDAKIIPVSALTGQGIDELRSYLVRMAMITRERSADGRFRLAIDRVFTLTGIGIVVTGTVHSGSIRVGDHVQVSPAGFAARIRSIHAQNKVAEIGKAGDRCALNLVGPEISKDAIHRGDVVLDPYLHAPTNRIDAILTTLTSEERSIGQWAPIRLHHAAVEVGAHIVLLDEKSIEPGMTADVQLVLDHPIAATVPDCFVIRDVSAQRTIGGGRFVDLRPPARKRRTPERNAQRRALANQSPKDAIAALLATPPFALDISVLARDRALSAEQLQEIVKSQHLIVLQSGDAATAISPPYWQAFASSLLDKLSEFHAESPDLQGIGREQLRLMLQPRLPKSVFPVALQKIIETGEIAMDGAFVRLAAHHVTLGAGDERAWKAIAPLIGGDERFRPPRVRDIAMIAKLPERDIRRLLKLASRLGWADEIAHDHFFLRETVREMIAIALDLGNRDKSGQFTAADFRDRLSNGRKVAIQILDFFDRRGVTLRKDDLRRINPHRMDLFGTLVPLPADAIGGESSPVGRSDFKSEWGSETVPGGFDSHSLPPPPLRKLR